MHQHWSEWLADKVIEEKKEPYVISGGMTTSGPAHLGTLCEFLFPSVIVKALKNRGKESKFYFVADILDAFDGVPVEMEKYSKELGPHLGKPLCNVPDPTGESKSFGDHYLDEAKALMVKFHVEPEIVRINEYYEQGKFDEWARFFLKNEDEARKIVEETSGKQEKKDWSPIMPICEKCGRIATTRVLSQDGENYEYSCDKDVKYVQGCGHKGKNSIGDHKYKIVWRLHWPAWKQVFGTSIEGAGIDHHTKGGSEDTCKAITNGLMKADYHIPYRYGFILFQGRKYSKSKGTGMGVRELVKLIPAEVIKFVLLRPDLEENIDINPTSQNLLKTLYDFETSARLEMSDEMNRSERKRAIAYQMSTEKVNWKTPFLDVMLYYQLYKDWEKVAELTKDPEGVAYLRPYIEEWIAKEFVPDDYSFKYEPHEPSENAKKFVSSLEPSMDALAIHNAVFDFAKANGIEPKELFAEIYDSMIRKPKGPRLGKFIAAIGVEKVKKDLGV
jgi:lysyl-tRNA synthetase class 1